MKLKFIFFYFIAIILLTAAGLYLSLNGSVLYEGADNKEWLSFMGRFLLWPYWIWSLISQKVFIEKECFSYTGLFLSQVVGYFLVILFVGKIIKIIKR